MATEPPEEIGNPYDWTEFYWGGFQPSMIGAVPIIDAFSKDKNDSINTILNATREKLKAHLKTDEIYKKNEIKFEDYFVTIHDEYADNENLYGDLKPKNNKDEKHEDNDDSKQTEKNLQLQNNKNDKVKKQRDELTIVRLWHKNVFIGVRGSGKADPGQFNFVAKFYARSGKFIVFEKWKQ
eukprot:69036_1